ncbi:MAG: 3-beta hydroxysteroid dehydrogenase, partial [Actinomycetota bacterium]
GHEVVGLARSDEAAERIAAAGAEVRRGDLDDLAGLRAGAADADAVVHLAYIHDFSNIGASAAADEAAIAAFGDELAGSGRPLVFASGVGVARRIGDDVDASAPGGHRFAAGRAALALAARGVRPVLVGLPPTVHGDGDKAFVPALIDVARRTGISAYPGDGTNRWSAVHRLDAARAFRLAAEHAPAGSALQVAGDDGIELREIASVIGEQLGLPVASAEPSHFGWLAAFLAMDAAAESGPTRELLGWEPVEAGLLDDLRHGTYFAG